MEMVYVGLGSNIDCPITRITQAIEQLNTLPGTMVLKSSSLYQTKPWGILDQADFINAVVKLQTNLSARDLLSRLLALEQFHGRERRERFGPRTLDCDILLYGEQRIEEEGLIVPHPFMHDRVFVLVPLAEIEQELVFNGKTLNDWMLQLDKTQVKKLTQNQEEFA